ncbi:unnamed protein product [Scytosiphon promiscuus]
MLDRISFAGAENDFCGYFVRRWRKNKFGVILHTFPRIFCYFSRILDVKTRFLSLREVPPGWGLRGRRPPGALPGGADRLRLLPALEQAKRPDFSNPALHTAHPHPPALHTHTHRLLPAHSARAGSLHSQHTQHGAGPPDLLSTERNQTRDRPVWTLGHLRERRMKLLVPLYIYPTRDGQIAPEWQKMKEASEAGVAVIAIANPGSGPGTEGDRPSYEQGMKALCDSGVEVVGYVASGYGRRSESKVKGDIDRYQEWYGQYLSGIFLDETAHVADDASDGDGLMCARYKGYVEHVRERLGGSATVVMNTGTMSTEARLTDGVGGDVVWNVLEDSREKMELAFGKAFPQRSKRDSGSKGKKGGKQQQQQQQPKKKSLLGGALSSIFGGGGDGGKAKKRKAIEGAPPEAPAHVKGRAAFMVHGAARLSYEEICHWVGQLQDGDWSHIYITDKIFDPTSCNTALHNPWDAIPTYWDKLVKGVGELGGSMSGDAEGTQTTGPSSSSS